MKTIQVVLVHISEAYWEVLQGLYQNKYGVLWSTYAAKLTSFCSKNMSNVFILKNKVPSMNP